MTAGPFYGIGENWMTKHTRTALGSGTMEVGRTRSGKVYNSMQADADLHTQSLNYFDYSATDAMERAQNIWEQKFMGQRNWINGEHADAYAEAKALCNEARQLHEFMEDHPIIGRQLTACVEALMQELEDGDAKIARGRSDFAHSYAGNLCSIVLGSIETGNWEWAQDGNELNYW